MIEVLLQRLKEYAEHHTDTAAFHRERVFTWQINLDADGRLRSLDLQRLTDPHSTGKPRGVTHLVPAVVRTVGVAANLAADDIQYVLGWPDTNSNPQRVAQCHAAFVELIEQWATSPEGADDPVAAAVAAFYRADGVVTINHPDDYSAKDGVIICVDDTPAHQATSAPAFWLTEVTRRKCSDRQDRCLVCGDSRPLLDTVPGKIPARLVPGATNDVALVSINEAVFGYDLTTKLASTPLCLACGEATTAGLNAVLSSPGSTTYPGQDSRVAWWVIGGRDTIVRLLRQPDIGQITQLLQDLHKPEHHRPQEPGAELAGRFHSLAVGGNIARVVVRDWVEMPLSAVEKNIARWFAEHEIVSVWNGDRVHSLGRLALAAGRWQRAQKQYGPFAQKGDHRPKHIYRDLLRSALRGTPLPPSVLAHVITRIRTDGHLDDARVALLRLALVRSRSTTSAREKPMPDLDPTNTDPAYVAGRLFATYEQLQYDTTRASNTTLNVTFGDRYFAGAIANPRVALLNGARDSKAWLKKLRRNRAGVAVNRQKRIDELYRLLEAQAGLPARLTLEQQATFVIGYHHQRAQQFATITNGTNPNDEEIS